MVSRELADGDLGYVGVGSSGPSAMFAVGIPIAAARLAQLTGKPNVGLFWGNLLDPDLSHIPPKWTEEHLMTWPAAAYLTTGQGNDMVLRGQIDVTFDSAAQVDRHGNLNITVVGDHSRPRVRLVGSLAQTEHLSSPTKPLVIVALNSRTFVERVDFITSPGYLTGGTSREETGLPPLRDYRIITDKAVFGFDETSKEMKLTSIHPGVSTEEVLAHMAFTPLIPHYVPTTEAPDSAELRLLREVIDPESALLDHAGRAMVSEG